LTFVKSISALSSLIAPIFYLYKYRVKTPKAQILLKIVLNICYIVSKSLKEIKKEYGLTDKDIAEIFDYKNVLSYRNSKAKQKIDTAIEQLYQLFKYNK